MFSKVFLFAGCFQLIHGQFDQVQLKAVIFKREEFVQELRLNSALLIVQ